MPKSQPLLMLTDTRLAELGDEPPPALTPAARPDWNVHLQTARQLVEATAAAPAQERLATGLPDLDRLLAGGLPRGGLAELVGRGSSGRFSCSLSTLATATAQGEVVALVDLGNQLDPQTAKAYGVDLERLLWVRPEHLRQALSAAEILLGGRFPLVVVELGLPPVPGGRGREAQWLRLARLARRHGGALLVSTPYRASGSAATVVLEVAPRTARWRGRGGSPRLLVGVDITVDREKSRHQPRRDRAAFSLRTVAERVLEGWSASARPSREISRGAESPSPDPLPATAARGLSSRRSPHGSWGGYRRPALAAETAAQGLVDSAFRAAKTSVG